MSRRAGTRNVRGVKTRRGSYDAIIVGGGHNGLVAATYLARTGRSVLVLERAGHTGGAAVSTRAFPGVDARLSRYSYLVSLLPHAIVRDLGLRFAVRRRTISSYTPHGPSGLLVADPARTQASLRALTGSDREWSAWQAFYARTARLGSALFDTLTEPLRTEAELRARVGDDATWEAFVERPLGEVVEATFAHDLVRGVVLTDALIGTFAGAHDVSGLQNRCFLYHVIGNGTGDWDVPVGGMGALTDALADAARGAGAELVCDAEVTAIATDGQRAEVNVGDELVVGARHVLANVAPAMLSRLLGQEPEAPAPQIRTLGWAVSTPQPPTSASSGAHGQARSRWKMWPAGSPSASSRSTGLEASRQGRPSASRARQSASGSARCSSRVANVAASARSRAATGSAANSRAGMCSPKRVSVWWPDARSSSPRIDGSVSEWQ